MYKLGCPRACPQLKVQMVDKLLILVNHDLRTRSNFPPWKQVNTTGDSRCHGTSSCPGLTDSDSESEHGLSPSRRPVPRLRRRSECGRGRSAACPGRGYRYGGCGTGPLQVSSGLGLAGMSFCRRGRQVPELQRAAATIVNR